MKRIYKIRILMFAIAAVFMFSLGQAAGTPNTFSLEAMDRHPGASGSVVIDKGHLSLQARGLKPDAIYTVWFVNMKPKKSEAGAGPPPYKFQTDNFGNGSYSTPLDENPIGTWQMIMVVLHPDGDPKNMKKMIGALKTNL